MVMQELCSFSFNCLCGWLVHRVCQPVRKIFVAIPHILKAFSTRVDDR